jgi:hypothetical protein
VERKRNAAATARAALAGLELQPRADGARPVFNQYGRHATVLSLQAAAAIVYGPKHFRVDIAALMWRLVRSQGVQS